MYFKPMLDLKLSLQLEIKNKNTLEFFEFIYKVCWGVIENTSTVDRIHFFPRNGYLTPLIWTSWPNFRKGTAHLISSKETDLVSVKGETR